MKRYFYKLLGTYLGLYVRPGDVVAELNPRHDILSSVLSATHHPVHTGDDASLFLKILDINPDFVILNGNLHAEKDIQLFLQNIRESISPGARVIVCYYSALWRPAVELASKLNIRNHHDVYHWFAPSDLQNFAELTGYQVIADDSKVLIPLWIPLLSGFVNRWLAPLPFFRLFNVLNIAVLRPKSAPRDMVNPSVSVVVPARNEAGNIEEIIRRLPHMGPDDELIFVEGNSTDDTWDVIGRVKERNPGRNIVIARQDGKGKGDAVRKGFGLATKEILMILDADMTVSPEDLPKFYDAIRRDVGEFINGSRLVYHMEKKAMRFFNIIGNKLFATVFSYLLNQPVKDTLCGTKVLSRVNYEKIAAQRAYFGDFDPFGDFDLLFGAARLGLKIIELPVPYKARTYGVTNIQRWKHGLILLKMLFFASRKIKFI